MAAVCAGGGIAGLRAQRSPQAAPGTGVVTVAAVRQAADRLLYDRIYAADVRPNDEAVARVLLMAERSASADVRAAFVRAVGRFEEPADLDRILPLLGDTSSTVRREAANAVAQAFAASESGAHDAAVVKAFEALRVRLPAEPDQITAGTMLEAIGDLPYRGPTALAAERLLLAETTPTFAFGSHSVPVRRVLGAVNGLESLIRHQPARPVEEATRRRLRELARPGVDPVGVNGPLLPAVRALLVLRDVDAATIGQAAVYRCPEGRECGWAIRQAAVRMTTAATSTFWEAQKRALEDPSYRVRIAALEVLAGAIPETHSCGYLESAFVDTDVHVVTAAIDLLNPICDEHDQIVDRLVLLTRDLGVDVKQRQWHAGGHALLALTRFDPAAARRIAEEVAAFHHTWYVRRIAADVAGATRDETLALDLAADKDANVRSAAIDALVRMQSAAVVPPATDALASDDYHLILTAARALSHATDVRAERALIEVIDRLTGPPVDAPGVPNDPGLPKDTSRDARVVVWETLRTLPAPGAEAIKRLLRHARDVDPIVADAAAATLSVWTGEHVAAQPTYRPPASGTADATRLSMFGVGGENDGLILTLDTGDRIPLALNLTDAPIAVGRFVANARSGYYDGQDVYDVLRDGYADTGSPGQNHDMGDSRYARDEIGFARHVRGAVGLGSHGRHTGDMRFFIDLVDLPALDRHATVLAEVANSNGCPRSPFEALDSLVEGVKIVKLDIGSIKACRN